MQALVWTAPRQMVVKDLPIPEPEEGEVLLKVSAAGICGSEIGGFLGHNSLRKPPLVMGHEAAGLVVTGPLPKGRRVTFNPLIVCGGCDRCRAGVTSLCRKRSLIGAHRPGAFAEYVTVPVKQCHDLPECFPDVGAALVEPMACGIRAARHSGAGPGRRLLVMGAGLIGLCCAAAARAAGCETILMADLSPRRLEIAKKWGVTETIDARGDVGAAVQKLAPGGVEAAIDAVGAAATRDQALKAAVPGCRVVFIGLHEEKSVIEANYIVRQEIEVVGSFAYTDADFKQSLDFLAGGAVRISDDWLEVRPLAEGFRSFTELADGTATATKIVLDLSR